MRLRGSGTPSSGEPRGCTGPECGLSSFCCGGAAGTDCRCEAGRCRMPPNSPPSTAGAPAPKRPAAVGDSEPRLSLRGYAAVLALALVVRMAWTVVVPVMPVSDGQAYDTFARNLAAG